MLSHIAGGFALVFGVIALCSVMIPRRPMTLCGETKGDIAAATVKKYAYEAYPLWRQAHPDRTCPASLFELNEYMNNKDIIDPWGGRYEMRCDPTTKWLYVQSPGEDGKRDTADDVRSY